jgi:hypothetical protein
MNIDVDALFNAIKNKSSARYVTRKGIRIKTEDYEILDSQTKEDLNLPPSVIDWSVVDTKLNELNQQWNNEKDKLKRKILETKYDLLVEITAGDCPSKIKELKLQLASLESMLDML